MSEFIVFLERGGPAMFALLAASIVVVAIVFERFVFLWHQRVDAEALVRRLGEKIAAGDTEGAIAVCDASRGAIPAVLRAGLARNEQDKSDIVDGLSIASRKRLRGFEQNLSVLGTVAVVAPFVGLFGTVLGIIHAFDDIALKGNSSPAVVAAGVSEALITTAAGLFVAVTSVVFFNYFRNRSRVAREEMLWAAEQLVELLHLRNTGRLAPADVSRLLDEAPAAAGR